MSVTVGSITSFVCLPQVRQFGGDISLSFLAFTSSVYCIHLQMHAGFQLFCRFLQAGGAVIISDRKSMVIEAFNGTLLFVTSLRC